MFEHFYHEIFKKTIVSFGTLFNHMTIYRSGGSDDPDTIIEVPLSYGPTQKFLARLNQEPNLNKPIQISLPRMSFELTGLSYDTTRKLASTQSFTTTIKSDGTDIRKAYMPVPYNINFELSIMTLLNDDMLQIIEQILPYFQPSYNLTIDLVSSIGEKRDIPIILDSIDTQDNYEGDYTARRSLIYTLKFTAKTFLFGPISGPETSKDIIKKVSLGFVSGDSSSVSTRNVVYSSEIKATKNYTGDVITHLSSDIQFDDNIIYVENSTNIFPQSYISIENETLYVKTKSNNQLTVIRGSYDTAPKSHVLGSIIKNITTNDNNLINAQDNFGFSGNID